MPAVRVDTSEWGFFESIGNMFSDLFLGTVGGEAVYKTDDGRYIYGSDDVIGVDHLDDYEDDDGELSRIGWRDSYQDLQYPPLIVEAEKRLNRLPYKMLIVGALVAGGAVFMMVKGKK